MIMTNPFKMWATDNLIILMSHSKTKSDRPHNFIQWVHLILDKNKTTKSCKHHWEYFLELLH